MINTEKNLNWVHREKKGVKSDKRDENSPVETIEERMKRLGTNEIDARIEAHTRGRKGVGGRKNKGNLEQGTDE